MAGNARLARKMDRDLIDLRYSVELPISWVLVKGNLDVSNSPGQPEAWQEIIRPFIEVQLCKSIGHGMYAVELLVLDQFFSVDRMVPETDMVTFLDTSLAHSTAKYKFILTHQPMKNC